MYTTYTTSLSLYEVLGLVGFCGLTAHQIFKRYEPSRIPVLFILLLVLPSLSAAIIFPYLNSVVHSISYAFGAYYGALITSLITYRLSPYHPLAAYPGPILARVTKFYAIRQMRTGKQHLYLQKLHQRYGPYVRVGPNELSFCDVDAISPVMGPHGMPKAASGEGRSLGAKNGYSTIALRDPKEHAHRRRYWTRALNTASIKDYEDAIVKRGTQLAEGIAKESAQQAGLVDLSRWMSLFAFDFMGDMAFGGGFELMKEGDTEGAWHILESTLHLTAQLGHIPWLTLIINELPLGISSKLRKFSTKRAITRKEQGSVTKDIFYHLADEEGKVDKQPPSFNQVISDATLTVIAGSDTTATVLSNIWYFLMKTPSAYKRLQQEIDAAFPRDDGVEPLDTHKQAEMPYLNAVINESLRLLPPVPSGSQRAPEIGSGGHMVGEHFVPEGTTVFVPTYAIQRDPRYFSPSPDQFWPDRWLNQPQPQQDAKVVNNPEAFVPFSYGPGNCAGKGLALAEMRLIICMIMQRFNFRFADGYDPNSWETKMEDWFVMKKSALPAIVTPRA